MRTSIASLTRPLSPVQLVLLGAAVAVGGLAGVMLSPRASVMRSRFNATHSTTENTVVNPVILDADGQPELAAPHGA